MIKYTPWSGRAGQGAQTVRQSTQSACLAQRLACAHTVQTALISSCAATARGVSVNVEQRACRIKKPCSQRVPPSATFCAARDPTLADSTLRGGKSLDLGWEETHLICPQGLVPAGMSPSWPRTCPAHSHLWAPSHTKLARERGAGAASQTQDPHRSSTCLSL